MTEGKPQTSLINSSVEVVEKTSAILAAIDECGCSHCKNLVKSAVVTSHSNDDTVPTPEPTGDGICLL